MQHLSVAVVQNAVADMPHWHLCALANFFVRPPSSFYVVLYSYGMYFVHAFLLFSLNFFTIIFNK